MRVVQDDLLQGVMFPCFLDPHLINLRELAAPQLFEQFDLTHLTLLHKGIQLLLIVLVSPRQLSIQLRDAFQVLGAIDHQVRAIGLRVAAGEADDQGLEVGLAAVGQLEGIGRKVHGV